MVAAERAAILLGCYRRDEVADPEIFSRGVIALLCSYPESVVRIVTDPARGIPSKIKWLPNIAEIREACEDQERPDRLAVERDARYAETRRLLVSHEPDEAERARVDALIDKLKAEMNPKKDMALVKAEAEAHLSSFATQILAGKNPLDGVTLSDYAREKYAAKPRASDADYARAMEQRGG